jgi:hypothetical protein
VAERVALISSGQVASRLGVTPERVRQMLREGKLEGIQAPNGRWQITCASVTGHLQKMGRTPRKDIADDLSALALQVQRLSESVDSLERREGAVGTFSAISRERDRYRADVTAMRGAALEIQASTTGLTEAVQQLLVVIERQANALGQLLAPASADDVLST